VILYFIYLEIIGFELFFLFVVTHRFIKLQILINVY